MRLGCRGGIISGTPNQSAQRFMSRKLSRALAGESTGTSGVPMARKTPPSSIGRHTSSAPVRAHSASIWVLAR